MDQWLLYFQPFDPLRSDWLRLSAKQIRLSESLLCKITQNLPRAEEDDANVENLGGATALYLGAGWKLISCFKILRLFSSTLAIYVLRFTTFCVKNFQRSKRNASELKTAWFAMFMLD